MTNAQIQSSLDFFASIGVEVAEAPLESSCVPGLSTSNGTLTLDREELTYPGDLFYAAARIAVTAPAQRPGLDDKPSLDPAEEMAALAWAYAASHHLGIDSHHVFHPHGYHNQSADLIAQFSQGTGPGIPMLFYWGMMTTFPQLTTWLRPATQIQPA